MNESIGEWIEGWREKAYSALIFSNWSMFSHVAAVPHKCFLILLLRKDGAGHTF